MKSKFKLFTCVLIGGLIAILTSCDTTGPSTTDSANELVLPGGSQFSRVFDGRDSLVTGGNGPTATKDNFVIVTEFLEIDGGGDDDVGRGGITDPENLDPSTLLFESREGNPILDPDGEQVTWGSFSSAQGAIIVKCMDKDTKVTVHLAGLIPNAVYTIQHKLFEPGSGDLLGQVGFTEMGKQPVPAQSKVRNSFRTSANGEGHISGFIKSGALQMGLIGNCMLDDATNAGKYVWETIAIYQINGSPGLDTDGTFVEQGGFTFHVWQ